MPSPPPRFAVIGAGSVGLSLAARLAAAVKACSANGPMVQSLIIEGSSLEVPKLLGICELSQGHHKRFSTECFKLHSSEVRLT